MKQKQPRAVKAWAIWMRMGGYVMRGLRNEAPALYETAAIAASMSAPESEEVVRVEIRPLPRRKAQKRKK